MKVNYAELMRCYVVGIPKIWELNGQGNPEIGIVIAPDPEKAVRYYLTREVPGHKEEIIKWLNQKYGSIERFAIHAPYHDIVVRDKFPKALIDEQNKRISAEISRVSGRNITTVEGIVNGLLPAKEESTRLRK